MSHAMTTADWAVNVCLAITVVMTAIPCWALLLFNDVFDRLHYLSIVTTIGTFSLLIAVVIKKGWGQATVKTILVFFVLLLINAVLSHATARAARVRELGHWTPQPEETVHRGSEER